MDAPAPVDHAVRPDACLDIVYSPETGLQAIGAMTVERRYQIPAGSAMTGVRFRPGMAGEFLGVSPAELTDRAVPLEDLLGQQARELQSKLAAVPDRAGALGAFLRVPERPPDLVRRAIEAMVEARGVADLDRIAAQSHLSPRQFRRRCLEASGLTPKHLCRVLRFRYAASVAAVSMGKPAPRADWAQIAADAGYFDQAHLIRDFREFTGRTPMAVFSNTAAAPII
jgi:AraC-like DNA-binding protein